VRALPAGMRETERIRWRCRRGMLELDLVLQRFLERRLHLLDPSELAALDTLLMYPDNDLFELVMGRREPGEGRLQPVLRLVRDS
jgi:antitoxin CptB